MTIQASRPPMLLPESVGAIAGAAADDLAVAGTAALAGGRAVLEYYRADDLAIEDGGRGPVTAADRASQTAIQVELQALRPDDPMRGEEGGADRATAAHGRLWVVDPLDGTREFIARIDEFSVIVGLAVDGEARLGAVYQPAADRLFLGVSDVGAWVIERAVAGGGDAALLAVREHAPTRLRLIESRSHPDERLQRLADRLADRVPCATVRSGSAGTKCARVALGEADLYVHPVPHLREWDTCAGEAVARGAGARVGDCGGEPLRYGKLDPSHPGGIFVAPPIVWDLVAADVAAVAPDRDGEPA